MMLMIMIDDGDGGRFEENYNLSHNNYSDQQRTHEYKFVIKNSLKKNKKQNCLET